MLGTPTLSSHRDTRPPTWDDAVGDVRKPHANGEASLCPSGADEALRTLGYSFAEPSSSSELEAWNPTAKQSWGNFMVDLFAGVEGFSKIGASDFS